MREIKYTLYDGSQRDNVDQLDMYKVVAKQVVTKTLHRFFLRQINNAVVNPADLKLSDLKREEGNMVEVSQDVFNLYHKVITNKSRTSFSSIQSMID
jgi:hypothetical protein